LEGTLLKIVFEKYASHRGWGAHFHKICKKLKKNHAKKTSKTKKVQQNYRDSKNEKKIMSAKRFQEAKVSQTLTGATFLLAEKGPAERD